MADYEVQINTPVTVAFTSVGFATGIGSPETIALLNGSITAISPSFVEVGKGLYTLTFTPTATGLYILFVQNQIITINVMTKTILSFLQNIEDEALGSWQWDKTGGILTMLRQDGSSLATFSVVDNNTTASRERQ